MTNFEKITASPERLAKELVYLTFFWDDSEGEDKFCWVSHTARGDAYFEDKAKAGTYARLVESRRRRLRRSLKSVLLTKMIVEYKIYWNILGVSLP